MTRTLFILLLSVFTLAASGQPAAELQKQISELLFKVRQLEEENKSIRSERRTADSVAYCAIRLEIFEAVFNVSQLDFDFCNTTEKIAVTGLFTRLMQANNPASDILGFRFTDLVFSSVEKHFKGELKNEEDKSRFSHVVSKIIGNPVVSSLANTNPVTSVVASVISTIAGFTTASVSLDKEGGRIRDVSVQQHDPFDQKSIIAFRNEMQVYIQFYDELISISDRYLAGLGQLDRKYAFLVESVNLYKDELTAFTGNKEGNKLAQITSMLPDPGQHDLDFHALLYEECIRKMVHSARKYPALKFSVTEFRREYTDLLSNYLESYAAALEKAGQFPDAVIDKSKTGALTGEIRDFLAGQHKAMRTGMETLPVQSQHSPRE